MGRLQTFGFTLVLGLILGFLTIDQTSTVQFFVQIVYLIGIICMYAGAPDKKKD